LFTAALLRCLAFGLALISTTAESEEAPVVAAAASMQFALREIVDTFHANTGKSVRLSFGSSGNLARQIRQGAPYQIFLSADEGFVLDLSRDGFTEDDGALYSIGRIVLFVPHESALKPDATFEDLHAALSDGRLKKFSIANPEHAPYGERAEEALRSAGLWDAIRDHLVYGENVAQAAQFAASQNAQGGIIAESLARSPKVSALGSFARIPQTEHRPLRQRMVLLKGASAAARQFYEYLARPPARAVFAKYGYSLPGKLD
jgi:molybdate transport system substrate-binding protein